MAERFHALGRLSAHRWHVGRGEDVLGFTWDGTCLAVCHDAATRTLLVWSAPRALDASRAGSLAARAWREAQDAYGIAPGRTWTVKLMGEAGALAVWSEAFARAGFPAAKCVPRGGTLECVAYAAHGRLRVASLDQAAPLASSSIAPARASALAPSSAAPVAPTVAPKRPLTVLIVDDSATIRKILSKLFSSDPDFGQVITAERPSQVEGLIASHAPDVITLDVHMPEMDGVTLLKAFLPRHPIPVVMITSIAMEDGPMVLDALETGAVDYIQKPSFDGLAAAAPLILEKVKAAAQARVHARRPAPRARAAAAPGLALNQDGLIVIGSSTGGTEALKQVLTQMPPNIPPILCVQHIPPVFSTAFAKRLNDLCPFSVKEAADGDAVLPGQVLIAPGGRHMRLAGSGPSWRVEITDDPHVNRHRPSVDYLFASVAAKKVANVTAVILTGMGGDGARGMLSLREAGAHTIAQDEATCVVYGMPREAVRLGGAVEVLPLHAVADALVRRFRAQKSA